jgi:GTP-binding protein Era
MKGVKVALIGEPNSGKSTLANRFLNKKICIVSAKPHSTREPTLAVYREEDFEIIFVDTPGIGTSRKKESLELVRKAISSIEDVDLLIFLIDATKKRISSKILQIAESTSKPKLALITKVDAVNKGRLLPLTAELSNVFKDILAFSAKNSYGYEFLLKTIKNYSQEKEESYLIDETNRSISMLICDRVREVLFDTFDDEIPYKISVDLKDMYKKKSENYIYINLGCTKSQKPIILNRIKELSIKIRENISQFLNEKVHSFVEVKVIY